MTKQPYFRHKILNHSSLVHDVIYERFQNSMFILGEDAFITCQATGDDPITLSWTKSGGYLPRSVRADNGRLEFKQISVSDQVWMNNF